MSDKVRIYNQVAGLLRTYDFISAPSDETSLTTALNAIYRDSVESTLRLDYWIFARRRAELSKDTTSPVFHWGYRYKRTPDDLRLLPITAQGNPYGATVPYEAEGRYILTNHSAPLPVRYITKTVTEDEFDPLFVRLLVLDLAELTAGGLTGKNGIFDRIAALRDQALIKASEANALEGGLDTTEPDAVEAARNTDWSM